MLPAIKLLRLAAVASVVFVLTACGGGGGGGGGDHGTTTPPDTTSNSITIAQQPQPLTVPSGLAAFFTVNVSGTGPFSYQWMRNGQNIPGANTSRLDLPTTSLQDNGALFSVTISAGTSTVTSTAAKLTVQASATMPVVFTHPQPLVIQVEGTATFTVAANSDSPLSIQWRKNGNPIPGATGTSYTIPRAAITDSGTFDAEITNAVGSVFSNTASLTVNPLAAPRDVDAGNMYILSALNSGPTLGSGNILSQTIATQGSATITLSPSGPLLPWNYSSSIALQDIEQGRFNSALDLPATSVLLGTLSTDTLGGLDIDRYSGATFIGTSSNFQLLANTILIGTRSGISIGLGNWKLTGGWQPGTFSGYKTARGSYVVGIPSSDGAVATIPSATYSGYASSGFERQYTAVNGFVEATAQASATYTAETGQLTITLSDFNSWARSIAYDAFSPTSTYVTTYSNVSSPMGLTPFTCTATVDPLLNRFTCSVTGAAQGSITGKFYGATGKQLGGTFAFIGNFGALPGDGLVGAFALKAD